MAEVVVIRRKVIEVYNISKKFRKSPKLEPSVILGRGHWIVALINAIKEKNYEYVTVLNKVSLTAHENEILGIVGPNGAGKTTLFKILSGMLFPDEGYGNILGLDLVKDFQEIKRVVNIIGTCEWLTFYEDLSVKENLEFIQKIYTFSGIKPIRDVDSVLEILNLKERISEKVRKLSSGMRQKLALAKCLIIYTPVILLDEPFRGLDILSVKELKEIIKNTLSKEDNETILISSHKLSYIEDLCERILIMNKGRIISSISVEKIKEFSKKFMVVELEVYGIYSEILNKLKKIFGQSIVYVFSFKYPYTRIVFRVLLARKEYSISELLDKLSKYNIRYLYIEVEDPVLEDYFTYLIKTGIGEEEYEDYRESFSLSEN
ncbi:MAG: hypothetical protein DRN04_10330 [Thermoprotei archaeon]|nr:MAG: hypothetical protein DRN04_10330 [Thermoprotei archaeon]